jgi:hypothetical protein
MKNLALAALATTCVSAIAMDHNEGTSRVQNSSTQTPRAEARVDYIYTDYHYGEPGFMNYNGEYQGILTRFGLKMPKDLGLQFEVSYLEGNYVYQGGTSKGVSVTADGRDRMILGKVLIEFQNLTDKQSPSLRPFTGLAYRALRNATDGALAYDREIDYLYVPGGLNGRIRLSSSWHLEWLTEADILLLGKVRSHLDQVSPSYNTVENTQSPGSGLGLLLELTVAYQVKQIGFHITPYFQYWHVGESDAQPATEPSMFGTIYSREPRNETRQIGLRAGVNY